jgi:superfamily II DNA or RNA helicase
MMSGGDESLNLVLRRRGPLDEVRFRRFVELARKVAVFDPECKVWRISSSKLATLGEDELEELLEELLRLSALTTNEVKELRNAWRRLRAGTIVAKGAGLELLGDESALRQVLESFGQYIYSLDGTVKVKSLLYLARLAREAEQRLGIRVLFDARLLSVTLERIDGRLCWCFNALDDVLVSKLNELGTLRYFVERALLSPEGVYEGSELVERRLKVARVLWREKCLVTPVALYQKYMDFLKSEGFTVENKIEELPELQMPLQKRFELLPHQEDAFKAWYRAKRGTIAIFTRGGKSFIALEAIHSLRKPTLILVTTKELLQTWLDYLEKYLGVPRHLVGVVGAGERKLGGITVATYTSAVKALDTLRGKFELVVFDEAHHVPATTFKSVALNVDAIYRMALSATPERRDKNEQILYELCGNLVFKLTYADLVRLRVAAPIEKFESIFAEGKEEKLSKLVQLLRKYESSKVLVFTQYLTTAEEVYARLLKEGFRAELITGETPSLKRELAFKRFLEGRVNVLVTTTVLDEGVTVPDAGVAVIYEGTGEARQMIQRIGRVLGHQPGKTAKVFELVDVLNPREKSAYLRRSWVRELYMEGVKYYRENAASLAESTAGYQRRMDYYLD